jgi:hypothetical protein
VTKEAKKTSFFLPTNDREDNLRSDWSKKLGVMPRASGTVLQLTAASGLNLPKIVFHSLTRDHEIVFESKAPMT